ncbi:hypothetical protein EDB89DRAFT_1983923 [Lactarius sanguifluus]|nr:hypothetical protein EDB89DRAFT_1983923 [Lactarius sanguifluus]
MCPDQSVSICTYRRIDQGRKTGESWSKKGAYMHIPVSCSPLIGPRKCFTHVEDKKAIDLNIRKRKGQKYVGKYQRPGNPSSCTHSAQPLAGSAVPSSERVGRFFARVEALRITILLATARGLGTLLLRLLDRRSGKAGAVGGTCASAARRRCVAGRGVVLRCVIGK